MASETAGVPLDRTHSGALNLAVLQRSDPSIEAIVASASHAAVYENRSNTEWVRRTLIGMLRGLVAHLHLVVAFAHAIGQEEY